MRPDLGDSTPTPGSRDPKQAFFDGLAAEWSARGFPGSEAGKLLRLRDRLGDLRDQVVLEPGCGAGRLTLALAQWVGPEGRVIAVEQSEGMHDEARQALESLPPAARARVSLVRADAVIWSGAEEAVDLVLLFCVFPHFADKGAALRRFSGLLRPRGRLVISHLEGSERLNWFHEGAGEPVRRDRIPPPDVLDRFLAAAGLEPVVWIDEDEEFYLEARLAESDAPGPTEVA